jgi:hypothetical protein
VTNGLARDEAALVQPHEPLPDGCRRNPKIHTDFLHGRRSQPVQPFQELPIVRFEDCFHGHVTWLLAARWRFPLCAIILRLIRNLDNRKCVISRTWEGKTVTRGFKETEPTSA